MTGWMYRRAIALKDLGERTGSLTLIRLGLWLKGRALARQVDVRRCL
jgi:hypothetical protein